MWKKWLAFSGLLGLIVLLDPTHTPAQPGKGGFGKGGFGQPSGTTVAPAPGGFGGFDPASRFKDADKNGDGRISYEEASDRFKPRFKDADKNGDGFVDLAEYTASVNSLFGGGSKGFGGTPTPVRPPAPATPFSTSLSGPGSPPPGPGGFGGSGGPGGRDQSPEDRALGRMREQDRNQDGKVSFEEADRRLKENWKVIDANGDGFVDMDEYKGYYAANDRGRGPGGDPSGGFGGPGGFGGGWDQRPGEKKETEEERPVAMRYGKLPKDLPGWFDQDDTDKDGQIGLYEWRRASKDMKEFTDMDLNSDGFVTADEYLRFARQRNIDTKIANYEETGTRPAAWGIGSVAPGSGDTKSKSGPGWGQPSSKGGDTSKTDNSKSERSDKGERDKDKSSKGNPWSKGK